MNWDISTKEGMANAVSWQTGHVALLADGGRWIVPRSGTIIEVHKSRKHARICAGLLPEPDIIKVFHAMGWTVYGPDGAVIEEGGEE